MSLYFRSLRSQQQPSANSAGLFWYAADASSLVDDVYRNGPNDRQVVGCCMVARSPRGGHRDSDGLRPAESRFSLILFAELRGKPHLCLNIVNLSIP